MIHVSVGWPLANVMEVKQTLHRDTLAAEIAGMWDKWQILRKPWLDAKKELREYLFATDTKSTSNGKLPWKNSTVTPKLTQIRDNLHANYMAALFPNENWLIWEGSDTDAVSKTKRQVIEAYMKNKCKASGFSTTISKLIYDYIDYGNAIAGHEYVSNIKIDENGDPSVVYMGPRALRISPLDINFDLAASSFDESPTIHRVLKSFGELLKDADSRPGLRYNPAILEKCKLYRRNLVDYSDMIKHAGFTVDGFNTMTSYFESNNVELLHFWGDLYDAKTGILHKDKIITVIDRIHVLRIVDNPSWLGTKPYKHVGWRLRPDNLWAQGPLDQLVGMQYRIDHLENLKADVFDLIAHPVIKIMGDTVEEFTFGPGVQIFCGDEGKVEFDRPEANALTADMQIDQYMNKMEEMAGAPKQAMGIRTPGEKTKYEVQVLENGAGRIFQSKVSWFEQNIIEPLLNSMLEESRRNLTEKDRIKIIDPDTGAARFMDITKEDIIAKGRLYPIGARHFAEQAKFTQEMTTTLQLIEQMPTVKPHISGLGAARALEHALGWESYGLVQPNIAISEQMETQKLMNSAQDSITKDSMTPGELQPEDDISLEPPTA